VPLAVGAVALVFAWPTRGAAVHAPSRVSGWLRFGVPIAVSAVMFWGLSSLDRYVLALLRDTGSAGVYSLGNSLGYQAVNIPLFAFLTGATPLLMTAFERTGREEVERLMRAYTRVMLLIALPIVALAAAVGDQAVDLVTGGKESYTSAGPVIPLVSVAALLTALGSLAAAGLGTARQTRFLVIGSGVGLLVNIVFDLILIPPYGIEGAALASPVGALAFLAVTYRFARRFARWHFPLETFVRALLGAAAAYAVARVAVPNGFGELASVLLALVLGAVAYVIALLVLGERKAGRPRPAGAAAP
jgi:O-antigen/teichoic acid export membrane protein